MAYTFTSGFWRGDMADPSDWQANDGSGHIYYGVPTADGIAYALHGGALSGTLTVQDFFIGGNVSMSGKTTTAAEPAS